MWGAEFTEGEEAHFLQAAGGSRDLVQALVRPLLQHSLRRQAVGLVEGEEEALVVEAVAEGGEHRSYAVSCMERSRCSLSRYLLYGR